MSKKNPPLPPKWNELLTDQFKLPYMISLRKFLFQEYANHIIYPPKSNTFKALQLVDYDEVKIVIIGQDPYHGPDQANGLAFAVSDQIMPKPPSLKRIFDEVERNTGEKLDRSKSALTGWAKQGVLLLNTSLTVRSGSPASHSNKGWEDFTNAIVCKLNERKDPIIFFLWGRHAQSKKDLISSPHIILMSPHPSPLARGFEGCEHFKKANELLTSLNKTPIDWCKISE